MSSRRVRGTCLLPGLLAWFLWVAGGEWGRGSEEGSADGEEGGWVQACKFSLPAAGRPVALSARRVCAWLGPACARRCCSGCAHARSSAYQPAPPLAPPPPVAEEQQRIQDQTQTNLVNLRCGGVCMRHKPFFSPIF